jgi:hypothetical protein
MSETPASDPNVSGERSVGVIARRLPPVLGSHTLHRAGPPSAHPVEDGMEATELGGVERCVQTHGHT